MSIVTCRTDGCENQNQPIEVADDGTEVQCGGMCHCTLREADTSHPDYPVSAPKLTVKEQVDSALAEQLPAAIEAALSKILTKYL